MELAKYIAVALISAILSAWYFKPSTGDGIIAAENPAIRDIGKETIAPVKVEVYKQGAKDKLPLPDDVKKDSDKHVISSTQMPADDHKHTVTTIIDATTGTSTTYDHREPLPWLRLEKRNEFRIDYGFKLTGAAFRMSYRVDLLQIKALHFGINTNVDSDGSYFVGAGGGFKF